MQRLKNWETATEFQLVRVWDPFLEIFERYDRDFYKIDKMLFSPACVIINNLRSGKIRNFGPVRNDILNASFGVG